MKRRRFELPVSRAQVRRVTTFHFPYVVSRDIQILGTAVLTEYSPASVPSNSEVLRRAYKPGVSELPACKWYLGGLEAPEANLKRRFKRRLQKTGLVNKWKELTTVGCTEIRNYQIRKEE